MRQLSLLKEELRLRFVVGESTELSENKEACRLAVGSVMYIYIDLCMHVCMYVCMYACMHVCMYVYVCLYVFMYVSMYAYMYVYIYIWVE